MRGHLHLEGGKGEELGPATECRRAMCRRVLTDAAASPRHILTCEARGFCVLTPFVTAQQASGSGRWHYTVPTFELMKSTDASHGGGCAGQDSKPCGVICAALCIAWADCLWCAAVLCSARLSVQAAAKPMGLLACSQHIKTAHASYLSHFFMTSSWVWVSGFSSCTALQFEVHGYCYRASR